MNDAQRAHFRRILEEWRRQLRQEVDRTVHHMKDEQRTSLTQLTARHKKKSSALNCALVTVNVS